MSTSCRPETSTFGRLNHLNLDDALMIDSVLTLLTRCDLTALLLRLIISNFCWKAVT
jgi:hypothetical protein